MNHSLHDDKTLMLEPFQQLAESTCAFFDAECQRLNVRPAEAVASLSTVLAGVVFSNYGDDPDMLELAHQMADKAARAVVAEMAKDNDEVSHK